MVSVAGLVAPRLALTGLLSVKVTVSFPSSSVSLTTVTVKVRLVCPAVNVNVPLAAR